MKIKETMNSKNTIKKLLSIAQKQQFIINKLAQNIIGKDDINSQYLKRAAQVAAVNSGFSATDIQVTRLEGTQGVNNLVTMESNYTVTLKGAPKNEKIRQNFINTFKSQVKNQNPKLESNLSIFFED